MDLSCIEGFLCGADLAGIQAWTYNLTVEEESCLLYTSPSPRD